MARVRTMLLIHGAWQGSWAFDAWRGELDRLGWKSYAIDLPGNGWPPAPDARASLESYTDHVVDTLTALAGPVVIVGHSGGGITASQVAEVLPERVAALVYLAGMMLPSGVSFKDIVDLCRAEQPGAELDGIAPYLDRQPNTEETRVQTAGALQIFLHDCEPVAARRAAALLRAQQETGRLMRPQLSAERFGSVPRIYVECTEDRSVVLPLQRKMQELTPGARSLSMVSGHVPQLARPAELAQRLCNLLEAMLDRTS